MGARCTQRPRFGRSHHEMPIVAAGGRSSPRFVEDGLDARRPSKKLDRRCLSGTRAAGTFPFAMRLRLATLLQSAAGGIYRNGGLVQDCRAVEKRARPGTTAVIRIECGAGRICRSLQQPREQAWAGGEKNASPHERQGPGCNSPRSKGPVGKGEGRKEVVRSLPVDAAGGKRHSTRPC